MNIVKLGSAFSQTKAGGGGQELDNFETQCGAAELRAEEFIC